MIDEINMGDIVRLNNTDQEGEVLEVIHVHTGEPGPLLRVQLHDTGTRKGKAGKAAGPDIAYYPVHSVMLVKAAAEAAPKKTNHDEKKPEHTGKK